MQMNFFAFFPGLYKDPNVGGDKIGFFVNPKQKTALRPSSAARASRWSPIPTPGRRAAIHQVVRQPDVQKKWWALGGYSCHKAVLNDPGFPNSAPFARLPEVDGIVKDFWAEPSYASLLQADAEARP
jgi:multiple sugar transport system substrate-binding protein